MSQIIRPLHPLCSVSTRLLALAVVVAGFAGACDAEIDAVDSADPAADELTARYTKELLVTDGDNEAVVIVSSEEPTDLDRYEDDSFELRPVFERPAAATERQSEADVDANDEQALPSEGVRIDVQDTFLEAGAIGYSLRYVGTAERGLSSCSSPQVQTSARDFAEVEVTSGGSCIETKISTRKYSWSWYTQKAYSPNLCPGNSLSGGKSNTDRIKVQHCLGPTVVTTFYN